MRWSLKPRNKPMASERLETGRETLVSTRAAVHFIAAIGAAGRLVSEEEPSLQFLTLGFTEPKGKR